MRFKLLPLPLKRGPRQALFWLAGVVETGNMKLETASKVNIVNFVNMWKSDKFTA